MEAFYPLHVYICEECLLVQLDEYVAPEKIFTDYAYYSSYSDSWVKHAEKYVEEMIPRFGLGEHSKVVELASNDGYLLQHFVKRNIPVLGVEPAENVAEAAIEKGIPTVVRFFGEDCARDLVSEHGQADLVLGNNVYAHVPALNDFTAGIKVLLAPGGVLTLEFPHLLRLMQENQFDTIYHEHFSYFSFLTVQKVLAKHGLAIFDVQELKSHGGSLRIFACHSESEDYAISDRVKELLEREEALGLDKLDGYTGFENKVRKIKQDLLSFLIEAKRTGKTVVAYGAPGKGNTLLNYCGIRQDFLDYAADRSDYKEGMYTPGTHIPIYKPERIRETKPDYILILPWNLKKEITQQMSFVKEWGAEFIVPIPSLERV
jgi:SAM-dependent methyltransferase